jgi:hypothetical protein
MLPGQVAEFIFKLNHPFNATTAKSLRVGTKHIKQDFLIQIRSHLGPEEAAQLSEFIGPSLFLDKMVDQNWGEALKSALVELMLGAEAAKKEALEASRIEAKRIDAEKKKADKNRLLEIPLDQSYLSEEIDEPLSEQKVIINIEDISKSFLYSPSQDKRYSHSFEVIKDSLSDVFGSRKGWDIYRQTNSSQCRLSYYPNRPRIFKEEGEQIFNEWSPAPWAVGWEHYRNGKLPEIPELFKILIHSLTEVERDRRSIQAWLRDATFTRADPVLVLCGVPGTGKNLFVEHLGKALVGEKNFNSASRGFSRSQFHVGVTNCRMFFLDETKLTESARETLKSYHNGRAAIERKGIDVGEQEKLWASFVLANNVEASIELQYPDRKFYLPDLNPKSIEATMGEKAARKFAKEFIEACASNDFLGEVANYLYHNFVEGESSDFHKQTEVFNRICLRSLPVWFNTIREFYKAQGLDGVKKIINSGDALRGLRNKPSYVEANELLEQYQKFTKDNFASALLHRDGSWSFIFNPDSKSTDSGPHVESEYAL